mmetsp:Transcript_10391/g.18757  ORF Transcript_10391/g.18757 Transcript_10391/m.18757 type:complete len:187 (+) Transcript_10391:146-706(+)|eukprot:CAMPEP_0201893360 /NCGR_PEP_ID=MMETSP0902-20130614/38472_1 /ASSEMBLY_ACC=CAM_ASM_000551 /TAXON_ID=420261 /ORGANISM="Thalassiosira antarctica, Strain CCMP982" /LENGTH=186 /DNA_ID=CAMNT_0048425117 /DNA_START=23 /DNA_END=583 /DNA_ORIENTATION=+
MARADFPDDGTSAGGDDTYTYDDTVGTDAEMTAQKKGNPILKRLFASCEDDALGSVHRAWAVTVLFMVIFLVVSCIEATKLQEDDSNASLALEIAAYWSALLHLILAIIGTFILKRFSTAFTVGCFLGVTTVVSQQNLLLFAAFYRYQHGNPTFNLIFADLALALFVILTFFSLILGHFRHHIIVR